MKYFILTAAGIPTIVFLIEIIKLADAVERGSVSPLEAYDTAPLGYVAVNLTVRESRYKHLL